MNLDQEVDRTLNLLRNKMRERRFTQQAVQDRLGWGRSYISQLLTKQKCLRVEQVLLILDVIGVEPAEFYTDLYLWPSDFTRSLLPQLKASPDGLEVEQVDGLNRDLRRHLRDFARFLLEKGVLTLGEIFPAGERKGDDT